ncbi:cobalt transporter CbiM [Propionivibrio sp.]|uniref:cobalt transporter CbiM n=1 Tax=Propionivibrio sp. TaxID=2212460 RepID=UPI003BF1D724
MHIPDGYLSPATCAVTYMVVLPFWYVALQRVKRLLHTRMVPLLAVFSAFSFVIMMFNLPLPGGTTGHAVGMAIATIVLGPWASMLAISVALLIQAVFFGDGGITTFGANCLNMAVVGSLVAYWTYTLIAGKSALDSSRRVVAAAIAGYLAINVAALLTAIEFGIQPMLFHDASGTPLYAPYPLAIAIPAMMIGHFSIAGLAELVISGGLVAYLQRANPDLLAYSAPTVATELATANVWKSTRALWYMLSGLMILSPIGLLAAGTAWGEWGVEDFANTKMREEIVSTSGGVALPDSVPPGLEHLASLWSAPIPDYAPSFLHSASVGYILSAVFGAGLILLLFLLISKFASKKVSVKL